MSFKSTASDRSVLSNFGEYSKNPAEHEMAAEAIRRYTVVLANKLQKTAVVKEGELMKQGGRHKGWRKRYFVMLENSILYLDKKNGSTRGGILMETVMCARSTTDHKRRDCFLLETTTGRNYVFAAPIKDVMLSWIDAINKLVLKSGASATLRTKYTPRTTPAGTFLLHYWPIDGRVLGIKLLLEDAGAYYIHEPDASQNNGFACFAPPALEHNGNVIGQSGAIMTYICTMLDKYMPADAVSKAHCAQVAANLMDIAAEAYQAKTSWKNYLASESSADVDAFCEERLPKWMQVLDNEIRACDGAFFFGFEPTYVDFLAVQLIHQLNFMLGESTMATMLPASLKLLQRALEARRKVAMYLKGSTRMPVLPGFLRHGANESNDHVTMLPTMKLYIDPISCHTHAVWALCKMGDLDIDVVPISLMAGESRTAAFIKRNPLHKVPTLDDGNGLVLGESNAILRFICNTYKSLGCELYPMEPAERGLVDMALDFRLTTMYPTVSALAYPYLNFGERNEEVQRAALNALTEENEGLHDGCMTVLESFFLKDRTFIAGEQVTIADLGIRGMLKLLQSTAGQPLAYTFTERIQKYIADVDAATPYGECCVAFDAYVTSLAPGAPGDHSDPPGASVTGAVDEQQAIHADTGASTHVQQPLEPPVAGADAEHTHAHVDSPPAEDPDMCTDSVTSTLPADEFSRSTSDEPESDSVDAVDSVDVVAETAAKTSDTDEEAPGVDDEDLADSDPGGAMQTASIQDELMVSNAGATQESDGDACVKPPDVDEDSQAEPLAEE